MLKKISCLLVFFMGTHLFCLNAKSISQFGQYVEFCLRASQNEEEFKNFKRNPIYRCILEHATYKQGEQYLDTICRNYSPLLSKMEEFKKNDSLGNPVTYHYPSIGKISPTTLQYIKIAGDLNHFFGDLHKLEVVEIGGGYGGQCFILSKLTGFVHYTIIDLPECLPLAEKFLAKQNIPSVSFLSHQNLDALSQADLVISNFAFSEISYEEQKIYLEKIIKKAPMGYMTINFISKLFGINCMSEEELVKFLKSCEREVIIMPEQPATGDNNIILIWKPRH